MIYFDNAATTACRFFDPSVWGNPSAPHALGRAAERQLAEAVETLARLLGCASEEVIFTSGGTESNNLALFGTAARFRKRGGHILTAPGEHPSVAEPLRRLAQDGFAVTSAPVDRWPELIRDDTFLVCFSHVHNETGDLRDISAIAAAVKTRNPRAAVLVDGVQGFTKEPADLQNVDFYSVSAHKCHAPAGVGLLMARRNAGLAPLLYGGGQQRGLRPGTENLPGILSFARAAQSLCLETAEHRSHVARLYGILARLAADCPDTVLNRAGTLFSPYILNISFLGLNAETLVNALSARGLYISTGSACHARGKKEPALTALGFEPARVRSAVRFSFCAFNTPDEAEAATALVADTVAELRGRKPYKGNER